MKKNKILLIVISVVVVLLISFGYYYIALPAINFHSPGFWKFIIFVMIIITASVWIIQHDNSGSKYKDIQGKSIKIPVIRFKTEVARIIFKVLAIFTVALIVVFIIGSIASSPIVNAGRYQKLLTVENRDFKQDIKEVAYDQIPLLDRDSASIIGTRVMGTMVDMVSQYEVSDMYSQINYNEKPVRISPLQYGNLIKWFTNNKKGIPAYIKVDMTTQEAECVRLSEGIKYSKSDHFSRYIYRHLRFAYPTYIFDDINFEIDENGTPYWVCPVKKYNIGLFGGQTIGRVVLCNAITGEMTDYKVEDVPSWVDKVYSADLLIELYDYNGTLKHGYINSVLSQKDCLQTTDGYNYIALDDDVWVYTGITSVGQDKSNVGFVLMNQRTMETRYYEISGAEEYSAMDSAEGRVQNLGYEATFPLLINVSGQPTYFMALKDDAGLVKCYAMLNIEKYQNVAIGDSVLQCEENYKKLLQDNGIIKESDVVEIKQTKSVTGVIETKTAIVTGGNTHFYITFAADEHIYDVDATVLYDIVRYDKGDNITFEYTEGDGLYQVKSLVKSQVPKQ
ncbi:MAG: CvpA family protein [Eubacteriales bacterium]|nr:CvpA family protein [Eubacteriales bacterium]